MVIIQLGYGALPLAHGSAIARLFLLFDVPGVHQVYFIYALFLCVCVCVSLISFGDTELILNLFGWGILFGWPLR